MPDQARYIGSSTGTQSRKSFTSGIELNRKLLRKGKSERNLIKKDSRKRGVYVSVFFPLIHNASHSLQRSKGKHKETRRIDDVPPRLVMKLTNFNTHRSSTTHYPHALIILEVPNTMLVFTSAEMPARFFVILICTRARMYFKRYSIAVIDNTYVQYPSLGGNASCASSPIASSSSSFQSQMMKHGLTLAVLSDLTIEAQVVCSRTEY